MSSNLKKTIMIAVLLISLLFSINYQILAADDNTIEEMDFKDTEIKDVLQALAESANKNLVVDNSVEGEISIHLRDINFEDALDLVISSSHLDYNLSDNTVVVATPERIEELFSEEDTKIKEIKHIDSSRAGEILEDIFPKLSSVTVTDNDQLIIKGEKNLVDQAVKMIDKIDITDDKEKAEEMEDEKEEEKILETKKVRDYNLSTITDTLESFFPDIQLNSNEDKNEIIVRGSETEITQALEIVEKLDSKDESLEKEEKEPEKTEEEKEKTSIARIDHLELETMENILDDTFSDLTLSLNPDSNEIIIKGKESNIKEAEDIISQLDKPKKQVMIEARVEEISRSETEEIGFKAEDNNLARITFYREGNKFTDAELNWPDYLDMLKQEGKSETLANPRMMTLNGEEGSLSIGDRIPAVMGDEEDSIEYIEAGINLEFEPWITKDNLVRLDVDTTASSLGEESHGDYPTIKNREASTTLELKDGETFAIGGLIQEDDKIDSKKVPFLSDFPIVGELFTRRSNEKRKTELMIFITPHIIDGRKEAEGEEYKKKSTLNYKEIKPPITLESDPLREYFWGNP